MKRFVLIPCIALLASGCATGPKPAAGPALDAVATVPVEPEKAWVGVAGTADRGRIERLDSAWTAALDEARRRGFTKAIAAENELLDPTAGLPRAAPPPGSYHCRVVKLGTQGNQRIAFNAYKPFFCYVEAEGDVLTIVKQTGSERPAGRIYPDSDARHVFLGTLGLGNEETPIPYGEDPKRDMAGVVERVAPFRWRLVIPWPQQESKLDVFELVPVTQ